MSKMKARAKFKWNSGYLAICCTKCSRILKAGIEFTPEDFAAYLGKRDLEPQYCDECKPKDKKKK